MLSSNRPEQLFGSSKSSFILIKSSPNPTKEKRKVKKKEREENEIRPNSQIHTNTSIL